MTSPSRPAARTPRPPLGAPAAWRARLLLAAFLVLPHPLPRVLAQAEKAVPGQQPADGVFDDERKPEPKPPGQAGTPAVTDRDSIGFTQENVAAQMGELEERMFRLAEALRSLEPENASRLKLALKFSREELILQQMKEAQKLLKEAQLGKAETEARELLAKLEHLRRLLLAEDLDFQMKLARLRQMRETMGQLERIIAEERREHAWSRSADDKQAELKALQAKRAGLEALVRVQQEVLDATRSATGAGGKLAREAAERVGPRQTQVRKDAAALAADPLFSSLQPPYLKQADPHLADANSYLGGGDGRAAVGSQEQALALLRKELERAGERVQALQKAVDGSEFTRFEKEQARNRNAADSLAATSARLGGRGVALQKDLIRAAGSMRDAEKDLEGIRARPAADNQLAALKHLVKSHDELGKGIESLLVELRSELQTRLLAELTEMHEAQAAIRETTEAQAPRLAQRSRTALVTVMGLAPREGELAERCDHLRALTEETEFGIALPTSLRVIGREMIKVRERLKEGDASPRTVTLEKRVEEDLLALAEAMRRLPPSTPPPPGAPLPTDLRARERELNRLVAELKMIRLLQVRLNDDTLEVDRGRPGDPVLPPDLRTLIEALRASQDEIHGSLKKLSERFEGPSGESEGEGEGKGEVEGEGKAKATGEGAAGPPPADR